MQMYVLGALTVSAIQPVWHVAVHYVLKSFTNHMGGHVETRLQLQSKSAAF